jgi:very-short-patch-repair endonuclease
MGRNDGKYNTASPDRYLLLKDFAQKNKQFPTDAERVLGPHDWGFNVIRFKNEDILRDISSVLEIIKINLNNGNE